MKYLVSLFLLKVKEDKGYLTLLISSRIIYTLCIKLVIRIRLLFAHTSKAQKMFILFTLS